MLGDVFGPGSSTDNAIARYDTASGKLIQNSGVVIDDADNVTGVVGFTATGTVEGATVTDGTASLNAGTLTGLVAPSAGSDAANKTYVDGQDALYLPLAGGNMTGVIDMGTNKITSVVDPTADQDAATKAYVDSVAAGLIYQDPCLYATTGSNLSGYSANVFTGQAATLDSGATIVTGDRILVKDQTDPIQNGIYVSQATATTWNRSTDMTAGTDATSFAVLVTAGTLNNGNSLHCYNWFKRRYYKYDMDAVRVKWWYCYSRRWFNQSCK